jgi:hypothetical protein
MLVNAINGRLACLQRWGRRAGAARRDRTGTCDTCPESDADWEDKTLGAKTALLAYAAERVRRIQGSGCTVMFG